MTGPGNGGRAEGYQALRESEELHRATLSSISDAVFVTDDDGAFKFICPNVDVIFGYDPDEVRSLSKLGRLLGENLFDPAELAAKGEIRNIEREVTAKSGERRTVLIHLKRVSIKGGSVLCTCRDVSELKVVERELAATRFNLTHAARLALAGQLLASIMHEIQQPLVAIDLNLRVGLDMLGDQEKATETEKLREIFASIHEGTSVAFEMIDRLRTLVRKRPLERRPLDLNGAANDVLHLVRPDAIRRGVALRAELAPDLPPVHADRVSLQQVILDLIVNAMDAMDGTEGERSVIVRTRPGVESVEVAVSDTGRGIPVEHRARLFEAFFTTKAEGVGLGLVIARSITEANGGQIWAEEDEGRGATFCVSLPVRGARRTPVDDAVVPTPSAA
jgi:PAS domain S-box-containing protein